MKIDLFCGPSAYGVDLASVLKPGDRIYPPAFRGSIGQLCAGRRRPGVIVLCDGRFHSVPAVGHVEIREAIAAGWTVWGVSSIGALRAVEMRDLGLRGWGTVYSLYAARPALEDDEVCLLHSPQPPYFPLSEPLIHLRHALRSTSDSVGISLSTATKALKLQRRRWFGHRDRTSMREDLLSSGATPRAADRLLDWMVAHPVKTTDLVDLLQKRPWEP